MWTIKTRVTYPDTTLTSEEFLEFLNNQPYGEVLIDLVPKFLAQKEEERFVVFGSGNIHHKDGVSFDDEISEIAWFQDGSPCYQVKNGTIIWVSEDQKVYQPEHRVATLRFIYKSLLEGKQVAIKYEQSSIAKIIKLNSMLVPLFAAADKAETINRCNPIDILAYGICVLGLQNDPAVKNSLEGVIPSLVKVYANTVWDFFEAADYENPEFA